MRPCIPDSLLIEMGIAIGIGGMAAASSSFSFSCSSPPLPSSSFRCCKRRSINRLCAASSHLRCRRRPLAPCFALPPETSLLVAGGLVGVAATLLLLQGKAAVDDQQQQQQQEQQQQQQEACGACGGTGLCPRCKGEGFVFKELPEETASKARKAAKNMATRYTAGLPTKWTYCNRCSSTRSCTACGGTGTTT